jgi:transcription initiation factor TFIIIB Brf1 subunit/transcription initiation factor TFIIB
LFHPTEFASVLEGKRPSSIAAASILFILRLMQMPFKQQELSNVAGISANTLRNVHKEINNHIDQLPPHLFALKKLGV